MTLKRLLILSLVLISATLPIKATKTWALQECIDHALKNNIEIKLQKLQQADASLNLQQSYANFLPNLNADATHGYSFGRSVDPYTNDFSTERIMRQNTGVSSSVVLFGGFQNVNYMRYNILRNTAARYDTEKLQNDIILTIAGAYLQILYYEDFIETSDQQLDIIRQQLLRTRALFEGGTLPRGSVLEIEARLAEEELNLINARNNLRMAYLELVQLLDLNPQDEFRVQKPSAEYDNPAILLSPEEIFNRALAVQPSISAAETRIELAAKQIDLDRGRISPTLSLVASIGTGYSQASMKFSGRENLGIMQIGFLADQTPVFANAYNNLFIRKPWNEQIRDNFNQYLGLNLRIPIFNRMEVHTRINQSRIDLERARSQYELNRNNLNKAIYQAHADALAAWQKYQATNKSLDAFKESFNYTRQRFDLGMVSTVEYNESQTRLARAEREVLQAKYDFIFKTKIMEFYMGQGFAL